MPSGRRLRIGLLACLAALPLAGCDRLCSQGAVTWCPRSEGDELNNAPGGVGFRARLDVGIDPHAAQLKVVFRGVAHDPDGDPLQFDWDLDGDGDFERTGRLVSHVYHRTARPKVTLRVTDFPRQLGAPGDVRSTRVVTIFSLPINHPPKVEIDRPFGLSAGGRPLYLGETNLFEGRVYDDDRRDGIASTRWRFGEDGRTDDVLQTRYAYRTPGLKQISLRAKDGFGAVGVDRVTVTVLAGRPTPRFSVSPGTPAVGQDVRLDGSGSSSPNGAIQTYHWVYDKDASPALASECCGAVETISFETPGVHFVKLDVTDSQGGYAEARHSMFVNPVPGGDQPPHAVFGWTPEQPAAAQDIVLDASGSSDPDGEIVDYLWDLDGDGSHSTSSGTDPIQHVSFFIPGEHTVGLLVIDSDGARDTTTRTIVVPPPGDGTIADFTVTPPSPVVGELVVLDGSGSSDPDGPIVRYEWDLDGDGSYEVDTGSETVTATTFATPGAHVVRLAVTNTAGRGATTQRTIDVRAADALAHEAGRHVAGRAPTTRLPFSAQLRGKPLGGHGERHRSGRRASLLGVLGRGRMRARVRRLPGRATHAEQALRRFLDAPWRTRVGFTRHERSGRLTARAIVLARTGRERHDQACLRLRITASPGHTPTGRLRFLGGRGPGVRLHGAGRFRFRLERDGSATVVGRIHARSGRKRALPASCRGLAVRSAPRRTTRRDQPSSRPADTATSVARDRSGFGLGTLQPKPFGERCSRAVCSFPCSSWWHAWRPQRPRTPVPSATARSPAAHMATTSGRSSAP